MRKFIAPVLFVLMALSASAQSPSASGSDVMLTGQILRSVNRDYLVASNKALVLVMQTDGNLCLYYGSNSTNFRSGAIWCSNAVGAGGRFSLVFGTDGNMCVTPGDERGPGAIWCNQRLSDGSAFAKLDDFGNFSVRAGTPSAPGALLWQTGVDLPKTVIQAVPPEGGSIKWSNGVSCSAPPPGSYAPQPVAVTDGTVIGPCARTVLQGTAITAEAVPAPLHKFRGWNDPGPCAKQGAVCSFAATSSASIGAVFSPMARVVITPADGGTISWNDAPSQCPPDCSRWFDDNTGISLTATPMPPNQFGGWGGACSESTSQVCGITVRGGSGDISIVPKFIPYGTITVPASLAYRVTGSGMNCPGTCSVSLPMNATYSFRVTQNNAYAFSAVFSGPPCPTNAVDCQITLTARNVTLPVTYYGIPVPITVQPAVGGVVPIRWSSGGTCPMTCSKDIAPGNTVVISAVSPSTRGDVFKRWSAGPCKDSTSTDCSFVVPVGTPVPTIAAEYSESVMLVIEAPDYTKLYWVDNGIWIPCATWSCSRFYQPDTVVEIAAATAPGGYEVRWTHPPCPSVGQKCTLKVPSYWSTIRAATVLPGAPWINP